MKKAVVVLVLALGFLVSCGSEPSVVGTWQLESVSGEELTESEKDMKITYKENGECESTRGDRTKEGTWKLSEDGKTMTMTSEGRDELMEDLEVTAEKMTFSAGEDKITLKRL